VVRTLDHTADTTIARAPVCLERHNPIIVGGCHLALLDIGQTREVIAFGPRAERRRQGLDHSPHRVTSQGRNQATHHLDGLQIGSLLRKLLVQATQLGLLLLTLLVHLLQGLQVGIVNTHWGNSNNTSSCTSCCRRTQNSLVGPTAGRLPQDGGKGVDMGLLTVGE